MLENAILNLSNDSLLFLVHQVSDWGSGAAAGFGWMRAPVAVRRLPDP
jgi:hypothetical protein